MANVNKVFLLGRLTADPELRYTTTGTPVTNVNIAVNRRIPSRDGGEGKEEVCFAPITLWGKTAEVFAEYMKKGREVFIEGHLKLDQWEDKQSGEKRYKLGVVAESFQFVGGKRQDEPAVEEGNSTEAEASKEGDVPF